MEALEEIQFGHWLKPILGVREALGFLIVQGAVTQGGDGNGCDVLLVRPVVWHYGLGRELDSCCSRVPLVYY